MRLGVFILSLFAAAGTASAGEESVTRYDIVAKGLTVGQAETVRSRVHREGQDYLRCQVTTKVDVDLIFVSCHLEGTEDVLFGPDGGIVQFAITATKDGHRHETGGGLTNGIYDCFSIVDGVTSRVSVARADFAGTTLDGLELRLEKGEAVTNRVFDCAQVKVFERSYRWSADDVLAVGKTNRSFRIVEFADQQKKGRRWVNTDEWGLFIGRQEAKEPSGSYVLRLREYFTRPLTTADASQRSESAR